MNPNFLHKDELAYELEVRGISSKGDTALLRKLFRALDKTEVEIQQEYLKSVELADWFSVIESKVCELYRLVVQGISTPAIVEPRVRTRLLHLQGRLAHLTAAGLCTTVEEESTRARLHDKLRQIADLMENTESQAQQQGQHDPGQPERERAALPESEVGTAAPNESRVFMSSIFQKLGNPLTSLLKEVPTVDGNNTRSLCEFLLKATQISRVGQIKEPTIYELLYPYCKDGMLAALNQALSEREKFEEFHERVLRYFVPNRVLGRLRVEEYERVQRLGEPLAAYVRAVRDAALVLRIEESESQTVARIVEGFTPDQRARFLFQTLPTTFRELERLEIVDRNVMYADQSRQGASTARPPAVFSSEQRKAGIPGQPLVSANDRSRNQPRCYSCGQKGHLQRHCGRPPVGTSKATHRDRRKL